MLNVRPCTVPVDTNNYDADLNNILEATVPN